MLVAIALIPTASARLSFGSENHSHAASSLTKRVLARIEYLIATPAQRRATIGITVAASVAVILWLTPPAEYLPEGEEPKVFAAMSPPPGYNLDTMHQIGTEVQDYLLPRTLLAALGRFSTTASIPAVSNTVKEQCEGESDRLDSELSMVRYIAWAIPSIGFIGTVRGIGDALGQAYKAVEGDISGVTASLGVAFNSTFVALVLSIIIMFCLHQLQLAQERLVLDSQRYADKRLLRHLVAH